HSCSTPAATRSGCTRRRTSTTSSTSPTRRSPPAWQEPYSPRESTNGGRRRSSAQAWPSPAQRRGSSWSTAPCDSGPRGWTSTTTTPWPTSPKGSSAPRWGRSSPSFACRGRGPRENSAAGANRSGCVTIVPAETAARAPLRLTYVGHATVLIELDGVDGVLISHGHPDHFHGASLSIVPGEPLLIMPRGLPPRGSPDDREVR